MVQGNADQRRDGCSDHDYKYDGEYRGDDHLDNCALHRRVGNAYTVGAEVFRKLLYGLDVLFNLGDGLLAQAGLILRLDLLPGEVKMDGDNSSVHCRILEERLDIRTDYIVHIRVFLVHLLLGLAEELQILLVLLKGLKHLLGAVFLQCGSSPGLKLVLCCSKVAHYAQDVVIIGDSLPELDDGVAEDLNESLVGSLELVGLLGLLDEVEVPLGLYWQGTCQLIS